MCSFCKIIDKKLETNLVYETDKIIIILDINPISEKHVLIIPKIHTDTITKIPLEYLSEIFSFASKIVYIYEKIYDVDGYSIVQNGGKFCDFRHFHVHVFPRKDNDGFGWKCSEKQSVATKEIAYEIRNYLENL